MPQFYRQLSNYPVFLRLTPWQRASLLVQAAPHVAKGVNLTVGYDLWGSIRLEGEPTAGSAVSLEAPEQYDVAGHTTEAAAQVAQLSKLIEGAQGDSDIEKALQRLFDQSDSKPAAASVVLPQEPTAAAAPTWRINYLEKSVQVGSKKAKKIGQGSRKWVFIHPDNPNWVVQVFNSERLLNWRHLKFFEHPENENVAKLHAIDAGPKWIDSGLIDGFPYQIVERIRGKALHELPPGALSKAERLVRELFGRMEPHGLLIDDLVPENIMVGTTGSQLKPRAYIADAGALTSIDQKTFSARTTEFFKRFRRP